MSIIKNFVAKLLFKKRGAIANNKAVEFSAKDIDKQLDELRESLAKALPNNQKFADFKKDLLNRGNKYMRTSFDIFERPMFQPLKKEKEAAVEYVLKKVVRYNKDFILWFARFG